jgi:hypothetical protein
MRSRSVHAGASAGLMRATGTPLLSTIYVARSSRTRLTSCPKFLAASVAEMRPVRARPFEYAISVFYVKPGTRSTKILLSDANLQAETFFAAIKTAVTSTPAVNRF